MIYSLLSYSVSAQVSLRKAMDAEKIMSKAVQTCVFCFLRLYAVYSGSDLDFLYLLESFAPIQHACESEQ